jgi:hypothetical protein
MENAANSFDMFVTPGFQHFHPAHPKAVGRGGSSGGIVGTAFNVASIVRGSAGNYTVTMTNAMADTNYAIVPGLMSSAGEKWIRALPASASAFAVEIGNTFNNGRDDQDFSFAVFGDMA